MTERNSFLPTVPAARISCIPLTGCSLTGADHFLGIVWVVRMIAERNQVKNLLLWHTEDGTFGRRRELYTREAGEYYHGNIWVPDDGDLIEL